MTRETAPAHLIDDSRVLGPRYTHMDEVAPAGAVVSDRYDEAGMRAVNV